MDISSIINEPYRLVPLKPLIKRYRNFLRKPTAKQPFVYMVEAESGKRYKWLSCLKENSRRLNAVREGSACIQDASFVPSIVRQDDLNIISEYVEGTMPLFDSPEFAKLLGGCLADVFSHEVEYVSWLPVKQKTMDIANDLCRQGWLTNSLYDGIKALLNSSSTETIRQSLVYADFKPSNFVITPEGKLFLVDLGGFCHEHLTGECLFGRPGNTIIMRDQFKQAFLAAGGPEEVFEHEPLLVTVHALKRIYSNIEVLKKLSPVSVLLILGRRKQIRKYIRRLIDVCADGYE